MTHYIANRAFEMTDAEWGLVLSLRTGPNSESEMSDVEVEAVLNSREPGREEKLQRYYLRIGRNARKQSLLSKQLSALCREIQGIEARIGALKQEQDRWNAALEGLQA